MTTDRGPRWVDPIRDAIEALGRNPVPAAQQPLQEGKLSPAAQGFLRSIERQATYTATGSRVLYADLEWSPELDELQSAGILRADPRTMGVWYLVMGAVRRELSMLPEKKKEKDHELDA